MTRLGVLGSTRAARGRALDRLRLDDAVAADAEEAFR
jgi:hypothetical protein